MSARRCRAAKREADLPRGLCCRRPDRSRTPIYIELYFWSARNAKDSRWWKVRHRFSDVVRLQSESIKNQPGYGTARAIGKLIEDPVWTKMGERHPHNACDLQRSHGKQRKTADHCPGFQPTEQFNISQASCIHAKHPGRWKFRFQCLREARAGLDKGELLLRYTSADEMPCEDAGACAEFDHRRIAWHDFPRDQRSERIAGGRQ